MKIFLRILFYWAIGETLFVGQISGARFLLSMALIAGLDIFSHWNAKTSANDV